MNPQLFTPDSKEAAPPTAPAPAAMSTARGVARLQRVAAKLADHFPGLSGVGATGTDWFCFAVRHGAVPPETLRVLAPGVKPALTPPTPEELRVLNCMVGGPQTGAEIAAALDLEPTGGGFTRRLSDLQARGLVYNPGKGYRLTEYGLWALTKE